MVDKSSLRISLTQSRHLLFKGNISRIYHLKMFLCSSLSTVSIKPCYHCQLDSVRPYLSDKLIVYIIQQISFQPHFMQIFVCLNILYVRIKFANI